MFGKLKYNEKKNKIKNFPKKFILFVKAFTKQQLFSAYSINKLKINIKKKNNHVQLYFYRKDHIVSFLAFFF